MRFTPALFKHAEVLLSELLRSPFPADLVVSRYFRQHRELGHADRGFVAESVYSVLRRKRSLSARCLDDVTSRRLLLASLACVQGEYHDPLQFDWSVLHEPCDILIRPDHVSAVCFMKALEARERIAADPPLVMGV